MAAGFPTSGLSLAARNAFWEVVEECLVEFHQESRPVAQLTALAFRRQLESPPVGIDGDPIYHEEPFYVACQLAGQYDARSMDNLLQNNNAKYQSLLAKHDW